MIKEMLYSLFENRVWLLSQVELDPKRIISLWCSTEFQYMLRFAPPLPIHY